jgi:hypothetical protein
MAIMDEFKIDIQLNQNIAKDYYYSRDVYKEQMKYLDKSNLYLGLGFLIFSLVLGYYKFEKLFSIVILAFGMSLYFLWTHLQLLYLRWRWLKTVDIAASSYQNVSSAKLVVNESGIGLYYNDDCDFLYWNTVKQFDIKHNKFLLIFSSETEYLFVPLKGLTKLNIDQLVNALTSKHIYQKSEGQEH